jgi:hypothetical protein
LSLATLAVVATILPPLRAFGPGRTYMRAAVFPTAYVLAFAIGTPAGLGRPIGLAALACLALSIAAIGFFLLFVRSRSTAHTSATPRGLGEACAVLRSLPNDGVLVMPFMQADYVAFESGKRVLWGGHCGDLRPLEAVTPVLRENVSDLAARFGLSYVLLDDAFASAEELRLKNFEIIWRQAPWSLLERPPSLTS